MPLQSKTAANVKNLCRTYSENSTSTLQPALLPRCNASPLMSHGHVSSTCACTLCVNTGRFVGLLRKWTPNRLVYHTRDAGHTFLLEACGMFTAPMPLLITSIDECFFLERILPLYVYCCRSKQCVVTAPSPSWKHRSQFFVMGQQRHYAPRRRPLFGKHELV